MGWGERHIPKGPSAAMKKLAIERSRYLTALHAIERLHTAMPGQDVCDVCYPQDHGRPCCTLREIRDALHPEGES